MLQPTPPRSLGRRQLLQQQVAAAGVVALPLSPAAAEDTVFERTIPQATLLRNLATAKPRDVVVTGANSGVGLAGVRTLGWLLHRSPAAPPPALCGRPRRSLRWCVVKHAAATRRRLCIAATNGDQQAHCALWLHAGQAADCRWPPRRLRLSHPSQGGRGCRRMRGVRGEQCAAQRRHSARRNMRLGVTRLGACSTLSSTGVT
jgi:hypothetical protein